jgi:glycosyltransferase involved in cell wall biosynthesis
MNDNDSDHELKKIMSSSYFKGVIVNQQCIKNYLLEKRLCNIEQVHYLHGLPMLEKKLQFDVCSKLYYPAGKRTLDICFAAAKNLQTGKDKGYDLFIAAAKILHRASKEICFHVVGGFSEKEIDVTELGNTIKFYGYLSAEKLPDTLRFFDIILSPNRPNMLGAGSFDGFPLGASVEASLVGCVIIATDELHENKYYVENEEIIIIKPILEDIIDKIGQLTMRPEKIRQIGVAGMNKTKQLYSYKNQLEPRIEILKNAIRENKI